MNAAEAALWATTLGSCGALALTLPSVGYLAGLTLFSWRHQAPAPPAQLPHFAVVVPAHNEAGQIEQTVRSLLAVDYPKENFAVWVVADNCTDATAERARAAGATVLERRHATERGKGYALNYAFAEVLRRPEFAATVVVDADTVVSPNLLRAFAARLSAGALAMQADYGVANPGASWRTRLMVLALSMFHRVRSLGRERLRLSCGLRGNGMCFSTACLRQFPHAAVGLVEDVEYGIALGRGGVRVIYVDEARVLGEFVSRGDASATQRARWEGGRRALVRAVLRPLLGDALRRRDGVLLDLALDLAVPPLSTVGALLTVGSAIELGRLALGGSIGASSWAWVAAWAGLSSYVVRGMMLSGQGLGSVVTLLGAPFYVLWKLRLKLGGKDRATGWVRTQRESEQGAADAPSGPPSPPSGT